MKNLMNEYVHASFAHPARQYMGKNFDGMGSCRILAVDGELIDVSGGFATFRVEVVYIDPADVESDKVPGEYGLQGHGHECTLTHPVKYIASVATHEPMPKDTAPADSP